MNPVVVRNVQIGIGRPKICIPIVGMTEEEILREAEELLAAPVDIVEWRVDWFTYVSELEQVKQMLGKLRKILGDVPILFTFRTAQEGGEKEISEEEYLKLNEAVIESGMADLIDVEVFQEEKTVKLLIDRAHKSGVKVIASNHDFEKTPPCGEIVRRLRLMQEFGADIPKIAVMPKSKKDVLTLLAATEEMAEEYADRPIITMSMAGLGSISRICGEVFGSALTFGTATKASAPGQIRADRLMETLQTVHESLS